MHFLGKDVEVITLPFFLLFGEYLLLEEAAPFTGPSLVCLSIFSSVATSFLSFFTELTQVPLHFKVSAYILDVASILSNLWPKRL